MTDLTELEARKEAALLELLSVGERWLEARAGRQQLAERIEQEQPPGLLDLSDGERPAYRLRAQCANCHWRGEVRFPKGESARYGRYVCPRCECRKVDVLSDFCGEDAG